MVESVAGPAGISGARRLIAGRRAWVHRAMRAAVGRVRQIGPAAIVGRTVGVFTQPGHCCCTSRLLRLSCCAAVGAIRMVDAICSIICVDVLAQQIVDEASAVGLCLEFGIAVDGEHAADDGEEDGVFQHTPLQTQRSLGLASP